MGGGGWGYPSYYPEKREAPAAPTPADKPTEDRLNAQYAVLRQEISSVEDLLAAGDIGLTEAEMKALDKGVVLMRVGAKHLKGVLRKRGYRQFKRVRVTA